MIHSIKCVQTTQIYILQVYGKMHTSNVSMLSELLNLLDVSIRTKMEKDLAVEKGGWFYAKPLNI